MQCVAPGLEVLVFTGSQLFPGEGAERVERRDLQPGLPAVVGGFGVGLGPVPLDGGGHPAHHPFLVRPGRRVRRVGVAGLQVRQPVRWVVQVVRVVRPAKAPGAVRAGARRPGGAAGRVVRTRGLDTAVVRPGREVPVLQVLRVTVVRDDPGGVELVPFVLQDLQSGGDVFLVVDGDLDLATGGEGVVADVHAGGDLGNAVSAVRAGVVDGHDVAARAVVIGDQRVAGIPGRGVPGRLGEV